jgi:HAD superfamily hydrolase (TIGR01549 family)
MSARDMVRARAVLLDALGTLVELEPPWLHLAEALGTRPNGGVVRAVKAEMAYYKDHSHEGRDAASLAELRRRCAAVLSRELGQRISVDTMMASIRFRAFGDAAPALAELRALGLRLVCASNWDVSLPEVLARCGLDRSLDGVVTSAEVGSRKPHPAIFEAALNRARCRPGEAVYVGDTPEEDLAGAQAAGIRALIIDRQGGADIDSLKAIRHHLEL